MPPAPSSGMAIRESLVVRYEGDRGKASTFTYTGALANGLRDIEALATQVKITGIELHRTEDLSLEELRKRAQESTTTSSLTASSHRKVQLFDKVTITQDGPKAR